MCFGSFTGAFTQAVAQCGQRRTILIRVQLFQIIDKSFRSVVLGFDRSSFGHRSPPMFSVLLLGLESSFNASRSFRRKLPSATATAFKARLEPLKLRVAI